MDEIEQKIMDKLILEGALEVAGIDSETGEILYNFSSKVKNIMPELYQEHLRTINEELMYLWEKGYIEMDLLSDNPNVVLSDKAFLEEEVNKLSQEKKRSLNEIKRILQS